MRKLTPKRIWLSIKGRIQSQLDRVEEYLNPDPRIQVGRYTYGVSRSVIPVLGGSNNAVTIGSFCSIAPGVLFVIGVHQMNSASTFPMRDIFLSQSNRDLWPVERITVGHDVWIATNAMILSNLTIGHGAVICAGAVVTKDVPPYAVVAGVPGRIIKYRMRPDQIEKLLQIAWWDWPDEKIRENVELFYKDTDEFLAVHHPVNANGK